MGKGQSKESRTGCDSGGDLRGGSVGIPSYTPAVDSGNQAADTAAVGSDENAGRQTVLGYREVEVTLTIPVYDMPDDGKSNVRRDIQTRRMLTRKQALVMRGITEGLRAQNASTSQGYSVSNPGRAVAWLLDQIAESM